MSNANDYDIDINVDFSEVKDDGGVFPPGKYMCTVSSAVAGRSKAGQPKIDVRYMIEGGEFDQRQILDTISFHPNKLAYTKRILAALGLDMSRPITGKLGELAETILGSRCLVITEVEQSTANDPDTGEPYPPRTRVKSVKKANASSVADVLG